MKMKSVTKEKLTELYWQNELGQRQIANLFIVDVDTVGQRMEKFQIPTRNYHDALILSYKDPKREMPSKPGRKASDETREKLSLSHKGQKPWNTGKKMTEEHKAILSRTHSSKEYKAKMQGVYKKRWDSLSAEDKSKRLLALMEGRRRHQKPNKLEQKIIELVQANNLPFKYVGNGQVILGGFNPDFINVNGKKQLIEVFGTYWHDVFDVAKRTEHFRQYGFDTLVIWEDELRDKDAVISKIKKFSRRKLSHAE